MWSLLKYLGFGALRTFFQTFTSAAHGAVSVFQTALEGAVQYHQRGIEFARTLGMSLKQSQAYTTVLTQRATELGFKRPPPSYTCIRRQMPVPSLSRRRRHRRCGLL